MIMKFFLPILYSSVIFILLIIGSIYLFKQIQLTQKIEKKIAVFQKRIQLNKTNYEDNYKLGQIFLRKKLYDQAILCFRKSLENWNDNDKIGLGCLYNTLGFTYINLNNYNYAIYYYKLAIYLLPDYILAIKNLTFTYEKIKNYTKANFISKLRNIY